MNISLSPEILVPRLGEYLIQQGQIDEAGLHRALDFQKEQQQAGRNMRLGEALTELKLIDRPSLDHAVTEQIIQLRTALEDANRFLERRVQERTAELQDALRKLSELSQMKANFVANVSHELRTPLTHIKGHLELLAGGVLGPLTPDQDKSLQVSQQAASRLESLIDSLILFALATRGEMSMRLGPTDLKKIAEEVIASSRPKADDRKVTLELVIDESLPLVNADGEKISWVILQLIDNAIKFSPSDGRVFLVLHAETEGMVMVEVKDTGIGIPHHRMQELFQPFHQLDGSSTRRYGGTGLGLALVQQIIHAHGSVIDVESEEGRGSIFRFPLLASENRGMM
jgi:signal transduction histidine kinase